MEPAPEMSRESEAYLSWHEELAAHAPLNDWAQYALMPGAEIVSYQVAYESDALDHGSDTKTVTLAVWYLSTEHQVHGGSSDPNFVEYTGQAAAEQLTALIEDLRASLER